MIVVWSRVRNFSMYNTVFYIFCQISHVQLWPQAKGKDWKRRYDVHFLDEIDSLSTYYPNIIISSACIFSCAQFQSSKMIYNFLKENR